MKAKQRCEECNALTGSASHDYCKPCCAKTGHQCDPDEGNMCLSCGYDGSEDAYAAAFDRAKDLRKYGD